MAMRFPRPVLRLAILSLLVSGGMALRKRQQAKAVPAKPSPSWPPFEPAATPPQVGFTEPLVGFTEPTAGFTEPLVGFTEPLVDSQMKWVAPVDGGCPDGFPLKANDNSGIFHVPGGRFYDRTVPERCYATADDALADGYRQAKARPSTKGQ